MANVDETVFNPEDNQIAETIRKAMQEKAANEKKPRKKIEVKPWQRVVIGGVSGVLLGAAGAYVATQLLKKSHDGDDHDADSNDSDIPMSTKVDDSQSFGEAFTAAREDVGPGGIFTWHGNVYGTYNNAEWESLSKEEQDQFNEEVTALQQGVEDPDDEQVAMLREADDADVQIVGAVDSDDDGDVAIINEDSEVYVVNVDDTSVVAVTDDETVSADEDLFAQQDLTQDSGDGMADLDGGFSTDVDVMI